MSMPPPACQKHGDAVLMQYECGEYPDRVFFCVPCNHYWQERQCGYSLEINPLHRQFG